MFVWQAHYEELKVARDTAKHLADETGQHLTSTAKQLKDVQEALANSSHEVRRLSLVVVFSV